MTIEYHPCHECKHRRYESMGFLSEAAVYCDHPDRGERVYWGYRVTDDKDDELCGPDRKLFVSVFADDNAQSGEGSTYENRNR